MVCKLNNGHNEESEYRVDIKFYVKIEPLLCRKLEEGYKN